MSVIFRLFVHVKFLCLFRSQNDSIMHPQHWLRRQIGSILPENRDHARKEWTTEEVRCVTPSDVLSDWSSQTKKGGLVSKQQQDMNGEIVARYSVTLCLSFSHYFESLFVMKILNACVG